MNSKKELKIKEISDEKIVEILQSATAASVAFSVIHDEGYARLKESFDSRGDWFDRESLIVFEYAGVEILRIPVSSLPVTIGRDEKNDYPLYFPSISRSHCHLELMGSLIRVFDDGSTNGLFLNGKKVDSEDLCEGDELGIGSLLLRVRKG